MAWRLWGGLKQERPVGQGAGSVQGREVPQSALCLPAKNWGRTWGSLKNPALPPVGSEPGPSIGEKAVSGHRVGSLLQALGGPGRPREAVVKITDNSQEGR